MMICTFATDSYGSDVYVCSFRNEVTVAVSRCRWRSDEPPPQLPKPYMEMTPAELVGFSLATQDWAYRAGKVPIGLPHDGQVMSFRYDWDAADKLEELREIGYRVPQEAIDYLRGTIAVVEDDNRKAKGDST